VRMTSLTMRRSRNRVPMNGIIRRRPKTCRYTYVFRMPDGGCHDLRAVRGIECCQAFRGGPSLGV
jgi:hypothetical protein